MKLTITVDVDDAKLQSLFSILSSGQPVITQVQSPTAQNPNPCPTTISSAVKPNPVITQPAPEPQPEPQPTDTNPPQTHTLDDIRNLVLQVAVTRRIALVQELLTKLNVAKLSEIPEDKLGEAFDFIQSFFK